MVILARVQTNFAFTKTYALITWLSFFHLNRFKEREKKGLFIDAGSRQSWPRPIGLNIACLNKNLQALEISFSSYVAVFDFWGLLISAMLFELLQSSSVQDGSGEVTCAQVLSLFSLKEGNVGN